MSDPVQLDAESYAMLRGVAERVFRSRGFGHGSIQPTLLLHEAWLKLSGSGTDFDSEAHFRNVAAKAMRQILIDRARRASAQKRGGAEQHRTTLTGLAAQEQRPVDVLDLERALAELEAADPRAARLVELRTYAGLSMPEVAVALDISESTAARSWRGARAFLAARLGAAGHGGGAG
jgi:RNA polymerase sigma-70 factor, ECF subfamily